MSPAAEPADLSSPSRPWLDQLLPLPLWWGRGGEEEGEGGEGAKEGKNITTCTINLSHWGAVFTIKSYHQ